MFVVIMTYVKPAEQVDSLLCAHQQFVQLGFDAGMFLLWGQRHPKQGSVILANAASREVLMAVLHQDPFYIYGLADYQVIEFLPSSWQEDLCNWFNHKSVE
jgi:uncharacterized protein YciI